MIFRLFLCVWAAFCLVLPTAFAGVEQLPEAEFRRLASELAPKVNLFRKVWAADPNAQFYGGTSRDFLYWIKGKFQDARNPADADRIAAELRRLPNIDVRDFIIGDSDVDVIAAYAPNVDVGDFGIKKLDAISSDVLDPKTERGITEINQGYIPAEKVRVAKEGVLTTPQLGDGVHEIYSGKLSVHFAPDELFKKTHYASQKLNHPVLLATRYLRLQAINYFKSHGQGYPDKATLLAGMDPASAEKVRSVIGATLNGRELKPYMKQPQFVKWLNGNIQKAFRSYTNPTAALQLMHEFKVDDLVGMYDGIETLNNYVFAKQRDPAKIAKQLADAGVKPEELYVPAAREFPDGTLYHGTRQEADFRSILLQGILPSGDGAAGPGLYGVALPNREFAESWGNDKNRLVGFPVKPGAKIIDVTKGKGAKLLAKFNGDLDAFAEAYGADLIKYPYTTEAYVVKNSEALGRPRGVHREIMTFSRAVEQADAVKTGDDLVRLEQNLALSRFSAEETKALVEGSSHLLELPILQNPKLTEDGRNLVQLAKSESPFGKLLKSDYLPQAMAKLETQLTTADDFLHWLQLQFEMAGSPPKRKQYGGMNVEVPSVSQHYDSRSVPPIGKLIEWAEQAKAKGILAAPAAPKDYGQLESRLMMAELLDRLGDGALSGKEPEKAARLHGLRDWIHQGVSEYRSAESAAQAEVRVLPELRDHLFFLEPDRVQSKLVHLAASSSLPAEEKKALIGRILRRQPEALQVATVNNRGPGTPEYEGAKGFLDLQKFFESDALRDYPGVAIQPLRLRDKMQLAAYSSIFTNHAGAEMIRKLREAALAHEEGGFIARALAHPEMDKKVWKDLIEQSPLYSGGGQRRIDSVITEGLPTKVPLPQQAFDAILENQVSSRWIQSPKGWAFYLDTIMQDPRFAGHPDALKWLVSFLSNPDLKREPRWLDSFWKLMPVFTEVFKDRAPSEIKALRKALSAVAPVDLSSAFTPLPEEMAPQTLRSRCSSWFRRLTGR